MQFLPGFPRRLLTALLLGLCAAPVLPAASGLYTVEIVVFDNGGTTGALSNKFAAPPVATDDIDATPAPTGRLNAAVNRLRSKGAVRILAHKAWTQSATPWDSGHGVSAAQAGLGNSIEGRISVERGEKLNLRLDLIVEEGGRRYRLNEVRRNVKPGQIQYFDHPAVGVLAVVTEAAG